MRGHTLIELLFVLLLIAVGLSSLVPTARALRDRAVAAASAEALVAGFATARAAAIREGGASLVVRAAAPGYRIDTRSRSGPWVSVAAGTLRLRLDSGRDSIVVRFDRMGVGRFASHSIEVAVGPASRSLVVSSYGRVRRR